MERRNKHLISICIRAFVSVALILILLYIMRGKYTEIWNALKGANIFFLSLGLAAYVAAIVIASLRLKLIIDAQHTVKVTLAEATSLTFIGYFFNNFLPTSIGGDVAKAYYLSRKSSDKLSSFTAVFVDRVIGLVTMILMAAAALLFFQNQSIDLNVKYTIYLITLCSLLAMLFALNKDLAKKFSPVLILLKPIEDKVRRIYNAVHLYKNHTVLMINSLVISVISQILFFASIGALALSIGSRIPSLELLLRMPIICTISLLPSINGLGVREGSTVVFFGPIIGKENAFTVSILWFLVLFITSVAGGLIYALSPQFKIKWGEINGKDISDTRTES